jgi:hypothetical protein
MRARHIDPQASQRARRPHVRLPVHSSPRTPATVSLDGEPPNEAAAGAGRRPACWRLGWRPATTGARVLLDVIQRELVATWGQTLPRHARFAASVERPAKRVG